MVKKTGEITNEQSIDYAINKLKIDLDMATKCQAHEDITYSKQIFLTDICETAKLILDSLDDKQYVELTVTIKKYGGMVAGIIPLNLFTLVGKSKGK